MRSRIYDCQYWKEHCFGLTAESLLDKAVDLRAVGGTFGASASRPFDNSPRRYSCVGTAAGYVCVHCCSTCWLLLHLH